MCGCSINGAVPFSRQYDVVLLKYIYATNYLKNYKSLLLINFNLKIKKTHIVHYPRYELRQRGKKITNVTTM